MKTLINPLKNINKVLTLITFIIVLMAASSCKEDEPVPAQPSADFAYQIDEFNTLEVSFTNSSKNGDTYFWEFGDQSTSIEENPVHTYGGEGDYSVKLTVTGKDGNTDEKTVIISVIELEKYLDRLYESTQIKKTSNIVYGKESSINKLNLFEVPENEDQLRPLILLSPGGGFKYYNRLEDINNMAKDLASRGYVVGVVLYHVDPNLDHGVPADVQTKWLEGTIDQKTAVRFFKKNASEYRIDPDNVFVGGWSNGGQLALTMATFQEEELATIEDEAIRTSVSTLVDEMGGLEGTEHLEFSSSVRGALMLNVYTFDLNSIDADDPALMFIHHKDSRISTGDLTIGTFQITGSPTDEFYYGPDPLTEKAMSVGYIMGDDLDYIVHQGDDYMDYIPGLTYHQPNFASLSSQNYDDIAHFFYRNKQ